MNEDRFGNWLRFFGFASSPFDKPDAVREDPEMWVRPVSFDRILGTAGNPETVLVFAPRGGGKTACRRLIEYYSSPQTGGGELSDVGGRILTVPHVKFEDSADCLRSGESVETEWHVKQILDEASKRLIDYIHMSDEVRGLLSDEVKTLYPQHRKELYALLDFYWRSWESERESLLALFPEFAQQTAPLPSTSSVEHLERFVALVCGKDGKGLGFNAIYVLLDGIDQIYETADLNDDTVLGLVLPLLANRRLMCDTAKLAFKCFLPAEIKDRLLGSPALKNTGLRREEIRWFDRNIGDILHRRLLQHKVNNKDRDNNEENFNSSFTRIEALCDPQLRGDIERRLFQVARGNPRNVIRLCDFMIEAHVKRNEGTELGNGDTLLNQLDWVDAVSKFQAEFRGERTSFVLRQSNDTAQNETVVRRDDIVKGDGSHTLTRQAANANASSNQSRPQHLILLVMSSPIDASPLDLQGEQRAIEQSLEMANMQGLTDLTVLPAVTIDDFRRALLHRDFTIVHFSGHGCGKKMLFRRDNGYKHAIPMVALADYLAKYIPPIECVVFNACYTLAEIRDIGPQIPFVIAADEELADSIALGFSRGFYEAISVGRNIEFAYSEGIHAVRFNEENEDPGIKLIRKRTS